MRNKQENCLFTIGCRKINLKLVNLKHDTLLTVEPNKNKIEA
jgi:hypothetical protein